MKIRSSFSFIQEAQNESDDEKQEEDLKPDVCQRYAVVFLF